MDHLVYHHVFPLLKIKVKGGAEAYLEIGQFLSLERAFKPTVHEFAAECARFGEREFWLRKCRAENQCVVFAECGGKELNCRNHTLQRNKKFGYRASPFAGYTTIAKP